MFKVTEVKLEDLRFLGGGQDLRLRTGRDRYGNSQCRSLPCRCGSQCSQSQLKQQFTGWTVQKLDSDFSPCCCLICCCLPESPPAPLPRIRRVPSPISLWCSGGDTHHQPHLGRFSINQVTPDVKSNQVISLLLSSQSVSPDKSPHTNCDSLFQLINDAPPPKPPYHPHLWTGFKQTCFHLPV